MKYLIFSFIFFINTGLVYSQIIEDNRIDKITNVHISKSSFVKLYSSGAGKMFARIVQADSSYSIVFKLQRTGVSNLSFQPGREVSLLLSDSSEVKLVTDRVFMTCSGCGSIKKSKRNGLELVLSLSESELNLLKKNDLKSISVLSDQLAWTEVLEEPFRSRLRLVASLFPNLTKPFFQ